MARVLMAALLVMAGCSDKDGAFDSGIDGDTDAADGGSADGGTTDGGATDGGGGDSDSGGAGDSDSGADTADFCHDLPTVTYNNFGAGFMTENCQGCHASTAPNRYGAPEEVFFDTVEDCWLWAERVLARATGDDATMPPQGGVNADDRTKLEWWLRCADEGT